MDKETLSNYGWIVIAVLVLVVMIALATPFGKFISNAVQSTTQGLFDVNQNALNAAGVPGLTIEDQEFDVPGTENEEEVVAGAWVTGYCSNPSHKDMGYWAHADDNWNCFVEEEKFLTWEELKDPANGEKYEYDASKITDTAILSGFTNSSNRIFKSIIIPEGITEIQAYAISSSFALMEIRFPTTLTSLGNNFIETSLSVVDLSNCNNLTTIQEDLFRYTYIGEIYLPNSINNMHTTAFYGGPGLIHYSGTKAEWQAITVNGPLYDEFSCTVICSDGELTFTC